MATLKTLWVSVCVSLTLITATRAQITPPPPPPRSTTRIPPRPFYTTTPGTPLSLPLGGRTYTPAHPYLFPQTNTPTLPRYELTLDPAYTSPPPVLNRSANSGSYLLTVPETAIPGFNFTLGFESLVDKPVKLKARILERVFFSTGRNDFQDFDVVSTYGVFVRGQPGLLHLPIPDNLRSSGNFYWNVSCGGGGGAGGDGGTFHCPFRRSDGHVTSIMRHLPHVTDVTTIFVQTDKAIYKPGQLVHYRVFAVYPDLQMYQGKFTIVIKDPNGNKLQYLREVTSQAGVVEGSLGLADQPVFGDWQIAVQIQTPSRTDSYTKSFTVQQYQLPRFEVTVDLPSYVLNTDTQIQGTVKATYTFGQPVRGMVELHIMSATARPDYCGNEPRHVEMSFDIDGEAKFQVPRSDLTRVVSTYSGAQIKVVAKVKEDLTDVTLEGSGVTTFRSTAYKVRVLDNTPSVFKPGLPFCVYALASMIDDSPVEGDNNVITMSVDAHYVIPADNSFLYGVKDFTGTYPLPTRHLPLPPSGVVKMNLDIPSNATRLDVMVGFKGQTASKQINQMFSLSNNFLQLTLLNADLKSGQTAKMEARATEPMTQMWYQILARGVVYDSKVIDAQGQRVVNFDLPLTAKMAPTVHMMAYYLRGDMELVPDSLAFNVDGVFDNEVSLEMSSNMSEPHSDLEVKVKADPDSVVSLLAVDQSVLLLKSGNDVTPDQVSTAMASYDRGTTPSHSTFALSLSQVSAQSTLERVGLHTHSDGHLSATSRPRPQLPQDAAIYGPDLLNPLNAYFTMYPTTPAMYPNNAMGGSGSGAMLPQPGMTLPPMLPGYMGMTTTMASRPGNTDETTAEQPLKEVDRVRNLFPETWLWLNTTVGANGSSSIQTTVPDTITSWITTAFATNSRTGLGLTHQPTKLTVFRSFFVSLTMPSSVIRGEHVVIQASVFNYLPSDVSVLVSLPGSSDYTSVVIADDGTETMTNGDVQHTVLVKSGGQSAVYFPLIPSTVGSVDVQVSARSTLAADALTRPLLVQAEGVPAEFSIPVFIDLDPSGADVITHTYPLTLPDDVIDGSLRSRIKVTGDLLGPSVAGLENLLRVPTGCGEQNMIRLAPDLYIANYLKATGQMTPAMTSRVQYLVQTGYQRELTYQRRDGSFSAFGNRDGTGNTWLTAFVVRVFHEARPYVYVDEGVLQRSLDWLTKRQNPDGSFNEFGNIFDPEMRQFKDHSTGLTSFVLLALLENTDVPATVVQAEALRSAIGNATAFLESQHDAIAGNDYLSLALTALALAKAGSPVADTVFSQMMAKASTEHGMTFWKVPTNTTTFDPWRNWRPTHVRARPIDIHVTSYALLVYSARSMFKEGMSVLHWLTRQRNPYGGFASTQDTIVGLQAMTEFVRRAVPRGYDVSIDVRAQHSDAHFDVTDNNALVLQAKDYNFVPSEVTFNATGRGLAVAELDVFFNVERDVTQPAFDVSTVLLDDYLNSFKVMICTRWLLPGESGMVVQEVGIPSGFAPDMTSVGNVAGIKRTEQRGRYLDIYFDKMTKNSVCYTVLFDRQAKVAHSQPSYVITQDYYEPSHRSTASYQSLSLKNSGICDVCPDCCHTH